MDNRQFVKGLSESQRRSRKTGRAIGGHAERMSKRFRGVGVAIGGLAAALGARALIGGIQRVANELEQVDRQARALGASRGTIQELTFTFRQFRLDNNDVADALGTLSDRAQDAIDGMQSFQDDFALIGIRVDELRGKRPGQLFRLFAENIAEIDDPTRRTAAAVRIFGDDLGRNLLPLLMQGEAGLHDYARQAREVGAVQSDEVVKANAEAAKTFRELGETISAQFTQTVAANAEEFSNLAESMISATVEAGKFINKFTTAVQVLSGSKQAFAMEDEIAAVEQKIKDIQGLVSGDTGMFGEALSPEAVDAQKSRLASLREELELLKQKQLELLTGGAPGGGDGGGPMKIGVDTSPGRGGAARLTEEEMKKQKKRLDVIRDSLSSEMELEKAHFEREQEFLATAHETLFESEAERKLMLENLERSHQERLFEIQAQNQGRLLQGHLQFLDMMEAADDASGKARVGIVSNALAQMTAEGAQHNRELFELNRAAAIANAIISTEQGAAKALEWGWPMGPIFAGIIWAAGAARINAIRSQSFSGGGGGAAPSTSAGGGVPAVQDVSGQGQAERPQQNVTIDIAGGDDRLLSKRQLRRLMEEMQEELGDDASIGTVRIA